MYCNSNTDTSANTEAAVVLKTIFLWRDEGGAGTQGAPKKWPTPGANLSCDGPGLTPARFSHRPLIFNVVTWVFGQFEL